MIVNGLRAIERRQMLFIGTASIVFVTGLFAAPLRRAPVSAVTRIEVISPEELRFWIPYDGDPQPLAFIRRQPDPMRRLLELGNSAAFRQQVARRSNYGTGRFEVVEARISGRRFLDVRGSGSTPREAAQTADLAASELVRWSVERKVSLRRLTELFLRRMLRAVEDRLNRCEISDDLERKSLRAHARFRTRQHEIALLRQSPLHYSEKPAGLREHPERFEWPPLRIVERAQSTEAPRGARSVLLWVVLSLFAGTATAMIRDRTARGGG